MFRFALLGESVAIRAELRNLNGSLSVLLDHGRGGSLYINVGHHSAPSSTRLDHGPKPILRLQSGELAREKVLVSQRLYFSAEGFRQGSERHRFALSAEQFAEEHDADRRARGRDPSGSLAERPSMPCGQNSASRGQRATTISSGWRALRSRLSCNRSGHESSLTAASCSVRRALFSCV